MSCSPVLGRPRRPLAHRAIREVQRAAQLQVDAIAAGRPHALAVLVSELRVDGRAETIGDLAHGGGGVERIAMRVG